MAGIQQVDAFSLLGPKEVWQIPSIGFAPNEIGGSRNVGDEYRINTPVVTYAFHPSFVDYFGTNGIKAVDQAIALLNKLPRVSRASADLSEFLTDDAARSHERAGALNLIDLKSTALSILIEHMGLSGEQHVFDLRQRTPLPGTCIFAYTTIVRNFDPVTFSVSRYVNGTTYTYEIFDTCPDAPGGEAVELVVDPTDFAFNAVASFFQSGVIGSYFLNLTRDDVGGLRYLYRKNNLNEESLPTNAFPVLSGSPWQPIDPFGTNTFATNTLAVRGGIEKVTYRKVNFTVPFGTEFKPRVQSYKLPLGSGGSQSVRRLVDVPDILFMAEDLADPNPSANPFFNPVLTRRSNIYVDNPSPDDGPGVIIPQTTITFNKLGPFFRNITPSFLYEESFNGFVWGSFDGTTNDPIVYPEGTNVRDIEDLVLQGN
ncbi:MAG: hypothetical protein ABIR24_06105 [Verrucomicrobiota bacterium]